MLGQINLGINTSKITNILWVETGGLFMATASVGITKVRRSPPNGLFKLFLIFPPRHRWLHHMTDETPIDRPPEVRKWTAEHSENTTLEANKKYVPYSTTRPKIEAWKPT
ncbi:hypothetical protein AHF37_01420 [Paragonimus kellicotti]|nr:hypothetical protein AHF37_01420 [Paragonimus kellicotti]